jgi:hypothetical protein
MSGNPEYANDHRWDGSLLASLDASKPWSVALNLYPEPVHVTDGTTTVQPPAWQWFDYLAGNCPYSYPPGPTD